MEVWKIVFPSNWVICRFHVNLPACRFLPFFSHIKGVGSNGHLRAVPVLRIWSVRLVCTRYVFFLPFCTLRLESQKLLFLVQIQSAKS